MFCFPLDYFFNTKYNTARNNRNETEMGHMIKLELLHPDDHARLNQIENLYLCAFPKNERKPFRLICQKSRDGVTDILSIEENGQFLGLAITIPYEDKVLLDYFAMNPESRGKGWGSQALKALLGYYEGCRMIIEIETTSQEADNLEERIRRKRFYQNNGITGLGFMADLFEVRMEILSNKTRVTFDEYLELYVKTYGERMREFVKMVI